MMDILFSLLLLLTVSLPILSQSAIFCDHDDRDDHVETRLFGPDHQIDDHNSKTAESSTSKLGGF